MWWRKWEVRWIPIVVGLFIYSSVMGDKFERIRDFRELWDDRAIFAALAAFYALNILVKLLVALLDQQALNDASVIGLGEQIDAIESRIEDLAFKIDFMPPSQADSTLSN